MKAVGHLIMIRWTNNQKDWQTDGPTTEKGSLGKHYKTWYQEWQEKKWIFISFNRLGIQRRFPLFFSVTSRWPVHPLMCFPYPTNSFYNQLAALPHRLLAHWCKTNEAYRIHFCQKEGINICQAGFECTTPRLTARVATDCAIGALSCSFRCPHPNTFYMLPKESLIVYVLRWDDHASLVIFTSENHKC